MRKHFPGSKQISSNKEQQQILAAAIKRKQQLDAQMAFDANNPKSRPTIVQEAILKEFGKKIIQLARGGNQCLIGSTLVLTPTGTRRIDELQPGDFVFSEHGTPIRVLKTFQNGRKKTKGLVRRGQEILRCTADHVFLVEEFSQQNGKSLGRQELSALNLKDNVAIVRQFVQTPMGLETPFAPYSLGAFLGDGCSRNRRLSISGKEGVPQAVAQELQTTVSKSSNLNYTWYFGQGTKVPDYYDVFCYNKYAHEKRLPYNTVKNWTRVSLIKLIAGLYDTDGALSFSSKAKTITWSLCMQAKEIVETVQRLLLDLWQIDSSISIDNRPKYANGPCYVLAIRNPHEIKRMLLELQPHLVSTHKHWKEEYNSLGKRSRPHHMSLKFTGEEREEEVYDISVDSPTNLYLLANGLVTHNCGKSQLGSRLIAWLLAENHPYWTRPPEWGQEPLQIIILGRNSKQMEDSLFRRIKAFFQEGELREVRIGNILQKVEHRLTKNSIIFQSYENENQARERVQSYSAHCVWIDEMPHTLALIDECLRRIQAKNGHMLLTFTPLIVSQEVRKFCDNLDNSIGKVYRLKMFDNPIYTPERQQEILAQMATLPEHVIKARLEGEWMAAENSVYYFDYNQMVEAPTNYSPAWRHVESSDPASTSAHGLCVFAEDPATGVWYLVKDDQLTNIQDPVNLLNKVMERTAGLNIVRRIYDPAAAWYAGIASRFGIQYMPVYHKQGRKMELIKQLQEKLGQTIKIAPWCTSFIDQIMNCHWSETNEMKIAKAQKYHLLDAATYFADNIPKPEAVFQNKSWDMALREGWSQTRQARAKEAELRHKSRSPGRVQGPIQVRRRRW